MAMVSLSVVIGHLPPWWSKYQSKTTSLGIVAPLGRTYRMLMITQTLSITLKLMLT